MANVWIDRETYDRLKRIAERDSRSLVAVIRLALAAYLKGAAVR